jgi:hypothetical protein
MTPQALAFLLGLVWIAVLALLWRALTRLEAVERRADPAARSPRGDSRGG